MSATPRGQQCSSMYLTAPRPTVPRQRSNSLPVGIATLNAEEAGILFSAAEKATARRRRILSIDNTSNWPLPRDSPMEDQSWPLPSSSTIRQSSYQTAQSLPLHSQASDVKNDKKQRLPTALKMTSGGQASRRSISSPTFAYNDNLFRTLPVDPVSPNKRQVSTRSLKSYADGLFQFTQVRLVSSVPQVQVHLASPQTGFFEDELVSSVGDSSHKSRPSLESKFSDWSVATSHDASRRDSLAQQDIPAIDLDMALMSPDSFFGELDDTLKKREVQHSLAPNGYASSATYEPPQAPEGSVVPQRQEKRPAEEVSYFTNYQRFLDDAHDTGDTERLLEPPESLTIDLSPLEYLTSPATPPPPKRSRATSIRHPVIARSYSSGNGSRFARSTPTTPYQIAEVAFRVPAFCVGAIG